MAFWHRARSDECFFSFLIQDPPLFHCWEADRGSRLSRNSCTPENNHLHIYSLCHSAPSPRNYFVSHSHPWRVSTFHKPECSPKWASSPGPSQSTRAWRSCSSRGPWRVPRARRSNRGSSRPSAGRERRMASFSGTTWARWRSSRPCRRSGPRASSEWSWGAGSSSRAGHASRTSWLRWLSRPGGVWTFPMKHEQEVWSSTVEIQLNS